MSDILTILGSSRSDGNTRYALDTFCDGRAVIPINLLDKKLSWYDYAHTNREDDFADILDEMLKARVIVFASPVYWYALSAPMKTFIDRFSDLLNIRKEQGEALRGTPVCLVSSGTDPVVPDCFEEAFKRTVTYLGLQYLGHAYLYVDKTGHREFTDTLNLGNVQQRVFSPAS